MNLPNMNNHNEAFRHWYALYTRSRFEKKVYQELSSSNITAFLPTITTTRVWSDRKKKVERALFPSYLFVNVNARERFEALQPVGAVRMVSFNGEPARIPEEQIEAVKRIIGAGLIPTVHQAFAIGTPVTIIAGPLIGLRGVVRELRGDCQFSIYVEGIGQSLTVTVDASYLEIDRQRAGEMMPLP